MKLMVLSSKYVKQFKKLINRRIPKGVKTIYVTNEKDALKNIKDVDILFCHDLYEKIFDNAKKLKWIHTPWTGVEKFVNNIPKNILFTRTVDINNRDIARYATAYILYFSQKINKRFKYQKIRRWEKEELAECSYKNVAIIGLGRIGKTIANILNNLGYNVYGYKQKKEGCKYVKKIFYKNQLKSLLSISDYIVVTLPLTSKTRNLITKKEFSIMKKNAVVINVARGGIINEKDLKNALNKKIIKTAVLDVQENEPLSKENTLWRIPNVIITPHVSGLPRLRKRVDFFIRNLEKFLNNEKLLGKVNLDDEY